jgi:hypothetical protein
MGAAHASIQNDSGLPQGPAGPSVLGSGCGRPAARVGKTNVRHKTARVHHAAWRRGGVAARGKGAAAGHAGVGLLRSGTLTDVPHRVTRREKCPKAKAQGLPYALAPRTLSREEWIERYKVPQSQSG